MPKRITIPSILILIAAFIGFSWYTGALDGSTGESREEILNQRLVGARIECETEVEGYIVSGVTTDTGQRGFAVFEPSDGGGYKLMGDFAPAGGKTAVGKAALNGRGYDLFWPSSPDAAKAEITYASGGKKDVKTLEANGGILCCPAPQGTYTVSAVFYTADGEKCQ